MRKSGAYWIVVSVVAAGLGVFRAAQPFAGDMGFFVSSTGGGCSQDDLKSTGGMGLIHCFAAD